MCNQLCLFCRSSARICLGVDRVDGRECFAASRARAPCPLSLSLELPPPPSHDPTTEPGREIIRSRKSRSKPQHPPTNQKEASPASPPLPTTMLNAQRVCSGSAAAAKPQVREISDAYRSLFPTRRTMERDSEEMGRNGDAEQQQRLQQRQCAPLCVCVTSVGGPILPPEPRDRDGFHALIPMRGSWGRIAPARDHAPRSYGMMRAFPPCSPRGESRPPLCA